MLISINIPCFNCEKTLREAVESCYHQGFLEDEFEIVMVDDGSTDNTSMVMKDLANQHKNISLFFHKNNLGGGAARNTAVANSQSEVVYCLDSDNILPPKTLYKMLQFMKEVQADAVGMNRSVKFKGNDVNNVSHIDHFSFSGEKIPVDSLLQKGVFNPLYSTFMHTKKAFVVAKGYPTEHGFDTQGFAWRFLASGLSAYTCPDVEDYHRIQHSESYYLREANAGKVNFNWQQVLGEHLPLFTSETQVFIKTFPCQDFTRNIWTEFVELPKVFKDDYLEIIKNGYIRTHISNNTLTAIKRNSPRGIFLRIVNRLKAIRNDHRTSRHK